MAEPPVNPTEQAIENQMAEAGALEVVAPPLETGPQYKVMGEEKIPVSKHLGPKWKGRIKAAERARKKFEDAWNEAIKYYQNDQLSHRTQGSPNRANNRARRHLSNGFYETENVVFANTVVLLPRLYPKSPRVEVTSNTDEGKQIERHVERLLNNLANHKVSPGLNLKPKMRRAILCALLTNLAWVMVGYNKREEVQPGTMQELQSLAKAYENAKTQEELREIEGKLQAIDEKTDILSEAGPFTKFFKPDQVVVDPTHTEPDFSDCGWMGHWEYVPTGLLRAMYMTKDTESDKWKSIYKPTHVISEKKGEEEDNVEFSLFDTQADYQSYGYSTREAFEANLVTKCWYIWDKATRRVYLFHDKDWTWPLWVMEDPYQLPRFFPYFPLRFHEDVDGGYSKGEVTYYLDQQDALNEIHSEKRLARQWIKRHVVYDNKQVTPEEAEKLLKGDDFTAIGVTKPESGKVEDVFGVIKPPSMNFEQIFDTEPVLQAIARLSSVNEVLRGAQFKTNTTNKAIEEYNSRDNIRFGERVDAIEDFVGEVLENVAYLVVQFMPEDDVRRFITLPQDLPWRNLPPDEIKQLFTFKVIGGSSQKPTSETKKEEAIRVGQVLGQFGQATPMAVVVALRMFEQAFDEVVIKSEDWQMIYQSIMQQMQPEQPPAETPDPAAQQAAGDENAIKQKVAQTIQALPPQAKQQLQQMVQQGIPPSEALKRVQGAQ